jgi:hypothetical protein
VNPLKAWRLTLAINPTGHWHAREMAAELFLKQTTGKGQSTRFFLESIFID